MSSVHVSQWAILLVVLKRVARHAVVEAVPLQQLDLHVRLFVGFDLQERDAPRVRPRAQPVTTLAWLRLLQRAVVALLNAAMIERVCRCTCE